MDPTNIGIVVAAGLLLAWSIGQRVWPTVSKWASKRKGPSSPTILDGFAALDTLEAMLPEEPKEQWDEIAAKLARARRR